MALVLLWVIFFLIVVLLFLWYAHETSRKTILMKKIPGTRGWPILGPAFEYLLTPEQVFTKLRAKYKTFKGITSLYIFRNGAVNIYDPEDIEKVLSSTRFNTKKQPYDFLMSWLGEGLLVSNGPKWYERRKMLTPAFHFNILKRYTQSFINNTEQFLKEVQNEVTKDQSDLTSLISKATLRIMCDTAMGISIDDHKQSETKKYFEGIHTVGQCIVQRICRIWYFSSFIYGLTSHARREAKAVLNLHNFTDNVIKERKTNLEDTRTETANDGKGKLAMLDLLLQNERDGKIDLLGIREEVDTFMFEGHDTTATALTFLIMRIANEPEIQDKIYEELDSIFQGSRRLPTVEDLNEMNYLQCCIKETLRLYPSVPFIARQIKEEVVLSGYTIPAGVNCYIHIYDLHHREDIYPEPEKFNPDRFLMENIDNRHRYSFIPFSAGPRNCIGQKFAYLEMKAVMTGLLRKFRIEAVTRTDELVLISDLVLRNAKPIYVRFRARQ
ncbi:unnamed protein product [Leptosia nina]|uniref:Cytochrome P450 n=1 Tax=Leptosia nina TaxID=320188 RepID=A0AAV1JMW8_9NEOP